MKYSKVVPGPTIYKITRFYLTLIIGFNTTQISTFCATSFVYRDFITTLIIEVLSSTITPIFIFSRASVSKIR